jgi:hypothetical protein
MCNFCNFALKINNSNLANIPHHSQNIPKSQHPTRNIQHATSNTQHPTPNTHTQHPTPDTRHPTPDIPKSQAQKNVAKNFTSKPRSHQTYIYTLLFCKSATMRCFTAFYRYFMPSFRC